MPISERLGRFATAVVCVSAFVIACSGSDGSQFGASSGDPGSSGGSSGASGSSGIFVFGDDDASTAAMECVSKTFCGGAGTCCAVGQECVDGGCVDPCASGIRCGATCCNTGTVCLSQQCVAPTGTCRDSFDCDDSEFCEPTLGKCLPQPTGVSACEYKPAPAPFAPVVEWSWTDSTIRAGYNQVINTPIVVDIDNDKIPDVIIVTSKSGAGTDTDFGEDDPAFVRVLDGRTGLEKWAATVDAYKDGTAGAPDYRVNPRGTPAVGDLDGDGTLEIVVPRRGNGVIAFRADGSLLWQSTQANGTTAYNGDFNSVTVALADLDNDGKSEVILGGVVLDYRGRLVTNNSIGRERWGANSAAYGAVSIVADVDGDAMTTAQYVVTGNRAIRKDGTFLWDVSSGVGALSDGYPAIADLDGDGIPELVVIAQGNVRVQNATTGALIATLPLQGTGQGGPPTIADFDNDGKMEISSANGTKYNVFEYDKNATPKLSVKWSATTQDGSSNVTGSSVFDFEGDGAAEVVYNDECYLRVYKGTDGTELFKVANSSATIHENPVLVDVDGDGNTEFVVAANDRNHLVNGLSCGYPTGTTPRHGVFVYGDANDKWVRTRKLWNQHAYHITNVDSNGRIPATETRSWDVGQNNNYRVSAQGKGAYNAPDLRVDLTVSTAACPAGVELRARVKNAGSLGVAAGVHVFFYAGTSASGMQLADKVTTRALLPGESEVVSFIVPSTTAATAFFVAADGGGGSSVIHECLEDNNGAGAGNVACPMVK